MSLGTKTKSPTTIAIIADTKTAAAPKSLAFFIFILYSSVMASARFSIAEFKISTTMTKAIVSINVSHSAIETFNKKPKTTTTIVAKTCIRALCSSRSKICNPANACLKLSKRFFNENGAIVFFNRNTSYKFFSRKSTKRLYKCKRVLPP